MQTSKVRNRVVYFPTGYRDEIPVSFDVRILGRESSPPGQVIDINWEGSPVSFNYYQIEYIIKGSGEVKSGDISYKVSAGDFFFAGKAYPKQIISDINDPVEKYFITAKGPLADGVLDAYFPDTQCFVCRCDVSEHFHTMMELCEKRKTRDAELYNELAVEFLKMVQTVSKVVMPPDGGFKKTTAESIMMYIDKNTMYDFTLEDMAKDLYCSPSGIVKIFKARYNTTPMKYITQKRIKTAKHYLISTDLPIETIAKLVPLGNNKYFSNLFKKIVGISPREYRKKKRKG